MPNITGCPSDMNATTDPGVSNTAVNWTAPVFTDNVDIINATSSHSPLDNFTIGVTEVSYNGSDSAGNVASCTFIITVSGKWKPKNMESDGFKLYFKICAIEGNVRKKSYWYQAYHSFEIRYYRPILLDKVIISCQIET